MDGRRHDDTQDAAAILRDLPAPLFVALARAARRAFDQLSRSDLPKSVAPFAGWKPERLTDGRPRRALAEALVEDSRLREAVAEGLDDGVVRAAEKVSATALAHRYGDDVAVVALVSLGRWEDVAVLSARTADRLAAAHRASAERTRRNRLAEMEAEMEQVQRRLSDELSEARAEREAQRRRADAAEARERQALEERERLRDDIARLRLQLEQLGAERDEQATKHRDRLARLRRRLRAAEARARVDDARALAVADDLEDLATRLRSAMAAEQERESSPVPERKTASQPALRQPAVARRGRPCRLPPGLTEDNERGVRSLLEVAGIGVIVDGYNVTMDPRGKPSGNLEEQRRWLVRVAAALAARFAAKVTVVFDGEAPRPGEGAAARGVHVVFAPPQEQADDRIVDLVAGLDRDAPVLVVTSDRDLQRRCAELGANVARSGPFLGAVNA